MWLGHQRLSKLLNFWIYFCSSKMLKNTWKKHLRLFIDLLVKNTLIAHGRVPNRWSRITLGQMRSFFSSGSGDTDRWHINEGLCATCQCPRCPNLEKRCICPKVIQLHLLRTLRFWLSTVFLIWKTVHLPQSNSTPPVKNSSSNQLWNCIRIIVIAHTICLLKTFVKK